MKKKKGGEIRPSDNRWKWKLFLTKSVLEGISVKKSSGNNPTVHPRIMPEKEWMYFPVTVVWFVKESWVSVCLLDIYIRVLPTIRATVVRNLTLGLFHCSTDNTGRLQDYKIKRKTNYREKMKKNAFSIKDPLDSKKVQYFLHVLWYSDSE